MSLDGSPLHAHFTEPDAVQKFVFLLLPGFSHLDLAAGVDSLAAANAAGAYPAFVWHLASETGEAVVSSTAIKVSVDSELPQTGRDTCIVICGAAGNHKASDRTKAWLRRAWRTGASVCGLGGAVILLAELGIASSGRLSAHWAIEPAVVELFPELEVACSTFEDGDRVASCGGSAATLDLFSRLISRRTSPAVAEQVADRLLRSTVRGSDDPQVKSDICRFGNRNTKLQHALQIIQANLEEPLSPSEIAAEVGLSTRQLERIFNRYLGTSPKTYILRRRIERAKVLLQQTPHRVTDVALACGFTSPSHFSRLYRKHFGISPHRERG